MRSLIFISAIVCTCGFSPLWARTIDSFAAGPVSLSVAPNEFPPDHVQTGLSADQVFGGGRSIGINGVQGTGKTGNVTASVDTATTSFEYSAAETSSGLIETFDMEWGDADWFTGPGTFSADLRDDGGEAFVIRFESATFVSSGGTAVASKQFNLWVASGNPGARTSRAAVFNVLSSTSPQTITIPFNAFNSAVDFSKVPAVRLLTVNLGGGSHFRLDSVATTPEPASSLVVLAVAALLVQRRRAPSTRQRP